MDLDEQHVIPLPVLFSKDRIPVTRSHTPINDDIRSWPHLRDINLPQIDADVGLLIGNNIPDVTIPLEVKLGPHGSPHAFRLPLGWTVRNVLRNNSVKLVVNQVDVKSIEGIQDLNELYVKSVHLDFPEKIIDDRPENSAEDQKFIDIVSHSKKLVGGHYQLQLPFCESAPSLLNNSYLALQCLNCLKRKLKQTPDFHRDYQEFMQTLLDRGFSEVVPEYDLVRFDGKMWYLPHHGVYQPNKPGRIRVVFDCSSKCQSVSLNDLLLQGPDFTNNLVSVLLKFRQQPVAVMGDVEKMSTKCWLLLMIVTV